MGVLKLIALLHLVYSCTCIDQLKPRFEWPKFECKFSPPDATRVTLDSTKCIPENNIPMSLDVYKDKLFIAVPRSDMNGKWKIGVPSSLNYIKLSEKTRSPLLIPYPDSEAHTTTDLSYPQAIISAIRVRVDRCDRLWVLDEGMTNATMKYPPTIIVYDLKTDTMIRKYSIPPTQFMKESRFTNIAVEDTDCQKTYAYAADMGEAAIVVYSWEKNESWRIKHHYFNLAPEACDYSINGRNYTWANSLYGLSLSAPNAGFSTLFFHPMSSNYEFSVSTKYLRNQSIADLNFFAFKNLGNRGSGHQSGASFVDPSTGVLFYSLINMNSVACWNWNTSESDFTKKQDTIYMNKETMVYPSDIKVDSGKTLWILSNKLPNLIDGSMVDPSAIHFRVFSVPVKDAISNTACDTLVSKSSGNNRASFVSLSFVVLLTWLTTVCMN